MTMVDNADDGFEQDKLAMEKAMKGVFR